MEDANTGEIVHVESKGSSMGLHGEAHSILVSSGCRSRILSEKCLKRVKGDKAPRKTISPGEVQGNMWDEGSKAVQVPWGSLELFGVLAFKGESAILRELNIELSPPQATGALCRATDSAVGSKLLQIIFYTFKSTWFSKGCMSP